MTSATGEATLHRAVHRRKKGIPSRRFFCCHGWCRLGAAECLSAYRTGVDENEPGVGVVRNDGLWSPDGAVNGAAGVNAADVSTHEFLHTLTAADLTTSTGIMDAELAIKHVESYARKRRIDSQTKRTVREYLKALSKTENSFSNHIGGLSVLVSR